MIFVLFIFVKLMQLLQGFLGLSALHLLIHPRLNCQSTIFYCNNCLKNVLLRKYASCSQNCRHNTSFISDLVIVRVLFIGPICTDS